MSSQAVGRCKQFFMIVGVFVVVGAWASIVCAEAYYVANQATGASDMNDGLSLSYTGQNHGPWLTLAKAAETAQAGDTVWVAEGDYTSDDMGWGIGAGVIWLCHSGTSSQPIRFIALPGQAVFVNSVIIEQKQWIQIEGFQFQNPGFSLPGGWVDMPAMVVDDPCVLIDPDEQWSTREANVRQKYATYMGIIDYFNTHYPTGVDINASSHITINGNSFQWYCFGVQLRNASSDVMVGGNQFHQCRTGIFTWRNDSNPSATLSTLSENSFAQMFADAIDVREAAEDVIIEGNQSSYVGIEHISLHSDATNCTIRGNTVQHGGYYTEVMEWPGSSAINVHTAGTGNLVERNTAIGQIDVTGLDGNGYIVDLLYGTPVTLRNNIAWRNMGTGITTTHSGSCVIVNNTLIENGYHAVDIHNAAGLRFAQADDVNHVIVNNLFLDNTAAGIYSYHRVASQTLIDHNHYHQSAGSALMWDGWTQDDRYYDTLAELRSETGWETNGLSADPLLADIEAGDFRLTVASPGLGQAEPGYAPADDHEGQSRDSNPDIGADEYVSPADFDLDGQVALADLGVMLGEWLAATGELISDMDDSGSVDAADFLLFTRYWP